MRQEMPENGRISRTSQIYCWGKRAIAWKLFDSYVQQVSERASGVPLLEEAVFGTAQELPNIGVPARYRTAFDGRGAWERTYGEDNTSCPGKHANLSARGAATGAPRGNGCLVHLVGDCLLLCLCQRGGH